MFQYLYAVLMMSESYAIDPIPRLEPLSRYIDHVSRDLSEVRDFMVSAAEQLETTARMTQMTQTRLNDSTGATREMKGGPAGDLEFHGLQRQILRFIRGKSLYYFEALLEELNDDEIIQVSDFVNTLTQEVNDEFYDLTLRQFELENQIRNLNENKLQMLRDIYLYNTRVYDKLVVELQEAHERLKNSAIELNQLRENFSIFSDVVIESHNQMALETMDPSRPVDNDIASLETPLVELTRLLLVRPTPEEAVATKVPIMKYIGFLRKNLHQLSVYKVINSTIAQVRKNFIEPVHSRHGEISSEKSVVIQRARDVLKFREATDIEIRKCMEEDSRIDTYTETDGIYDL